VNTTATKNKQTDNIPLAVAVIVITVLALSLGDALIKLSSSRFVIWQIFVLRSVLAIPCLLLIMFALSKRSTLAPTAIGWVVLRSLLLVTMWVSYYLSLPHLPLSVAAAAYYTLPIFITLFSAVLVGERITRAGWLAVVMGFTGVVLVLRPDTSALTLHAALPLFAAMLYALAMILTRTKCREEHPLSLALSLNVTFLVVGVVATLFITTLPTESRQGFLLSLWAAMGTKEWLAIALLATVIVIASVGTAIAYQNAPSSVIGVFDFAYVGFAVLWGIVFFAEIPDLVAIVGMVLIVLAGVVSLRG